MKHGCAVPLIGGLSVAAKKVTGVDPAFLISYTPFTENEQNVKSYFPETPHYLLDTENYGGFDPKLHQDTDFVQALCPCAGLSQLSNGSQDHRDQMNYWMLETARLVTEEVRPKVFWGENASALYTNSGKHVREQLRATAEKNGYSFSLYHTNTMFHGIPQNRKRSFYFFWRDSTAPIFDYYRKPLKNLSDYLSEVPVGVKHHTQEDLDNAREHLAADPFVIFLQTKYQGTGIDMIRKFLDDTDTRGTTMTSYLLATDQLAEARDWLLTNGYHRQAKEAGRIIEKTLTGGRFWDSSFPIYRGSAEFSTLIARTFLAIHPTEDRVITTREAMHLMGLPNDFELTSGCENHVCQNVPVSTGSDMVREVIKFIKGESKLSNSTFLMQSNLAQRIDCQESSLLEF